MFAAHLFPLGLQCPSHSKNNSSVDILPAHGRLKELCEQFDKDVRTTVAITDTCTIEISSLSSIQPLLGSNEVVFQKEAA